MLINVSKTLANPKRSIIICDNTAHVQKVAYGHSMSSHETVGPSVAGGEVGEAAST